jgi:hypothetical protein
VRLKRVDTLGRSEEMLLEELGEYVHLG